MKASEALKKLSEAETQLTGAKLKQLRTAYEKAREEHPIVDAVEIALETIELTSA
jgi:hypothetical protein